jgi:hypothetical protein
MKKIRAEQNEQLLAKYLNLRKFQYTSGNQTPLTTDTLPESQISLDYRYHKYHNF